MLENKRVFVIINSNFIGDMLLTNSLVQNIKRIFEDSYVVMISAPGLVDVAKYQEGVDEVIVWDRKRKDKGFIRMLRFALKFPYKNIFACIPIYGGDRQVILSKLLNPKYILTPQYKFINKFFAKSKYNFEYNGEKTQEQILSVLNGVTKERLIDSNIKYNIENEEINDLPSHYVVIIPTSTRKSKEMPIETIVQLLQYKQNINFVLLGQGASITEISEKLKKYNFNNLFDYSNKTTISQVAQIINKSNKVMAVDTGLMHMACALDKPTVAIFYEDNMQAFMPNEKMYNIKIIYKNYEIDNIVKEFDKIGVKEKINA